MKNPQSVKSMIRLPIGKLYQIKFSYKCKSFEAFINDKRYDFKCNDTIFLLIDVIAYDHTFMYVRLNALFSNGERGQIPYIKPTELILIQ
jgi:hypothetical protein